MFLVPTFDQSDVFLVPTFDLSSEVSTVKYISSSPDFLFDHTDQIEEPLHMIELLRSKQMFT